ncbi:hypothetical protein ACOMHN_002239 [Nucella lapillus]
MRRPSFQYMYDMSELWAAGNVSGGGGPFVLEASVCSSSLQQQSASGCICLQQQSAAAVCIWLHLSAGRFLEDGLFLPLFRRPTAKVTSFPLM